MEKVYFIIGATSDIASEYIKKINSKKEKSTVIALYSGDKSKLENLSNSLDNIIFDFVECNLLDKLQIQKTIEYIQEKYQAPTHILHTAAKKFEYVKFSKFNWDDVNIDLEIQVHSFSEFLKAFLPNMSKNRYGKIVVMLSSVTKGLPPKYLTQYTTVKYALMGLLNSLVSEYKEKGININAVSPTMVETSFLEKIDSRLIEMNAMNSGMKRNIKPIEVASTIDFLMSDESEYINGLNLGITGGDFI